MDETKRWLHLTKPSKGTRVVLDLLEYPEQTNVEVDAVCDQPHKNNNHENDLVVAYPVAYTAQVPQRAGGTGDFAVPFDGGGAGARDKGGGVVVEAEGEGGGPGADK